MKLKISNGRVIDPANHIDDQLDIFIDNGLILAVGKTPEAFIPDRIIAVSYTHLRAHET